MTDIWNANAVSLLARFWRVPFWQRCILATALFSHACACNKFAGFRFSNRDLIVWHVRFRIYVVVVALHYGRSLVFSLFRWCNLLIALLGIKVSACNEFGAFRVRKRYFNIVAYKVFDFWCRGVDELRYRLSPSSRRSFTARQFYHDGRLKAYRLFRYDFDLKIWRVSFWQRCILAIALFSHACACNKFAWFRFSKSDVIVWRVRFRMQMQFQYLRDTISIWKFDACRFGSDASQIWPTMDVSKTYAVPRAARFNFILKLRRVPVLACVTCARVGLAARHNLILNISRVSCWHASQI